MKGYFKLPRELMQHEIFNNPTDLRLLLLILTNANFNDEYEHKGQTLKKGEWLRSYSKLQEDLTFKMDKSTIVPTIKEIRGAVARLKRADLICFKGSYLGILFSVNEVLMQQVFGNTENVERADLRAVEGQTSGNRSIKNIKYKDISNKKDNITLTSNRGCPSFADVYHHNYGKMLTPIQIQDFISYMDKDGVEEELLNFAFEVAIKVSSHINYVRAIINNWIASGIRTKKGAEQEYNRKRGNTDHGKDQYSDIDFGW